MLLKKLTNFTYISSIEHSVVYRFPIAPCRSDLYVFNTSGAGSTTSIVSNFAPGKSSCWPSGAGNIVWRENASSRLIIIGKCVSTVRAFDAKLRGTKIGRVECACYGSKVGPSWECCQPTNRWTICARSGWSFNASSCSWIGAHALHVSVAVPFWRYVYIPNITFPII